MTNFRRSSSSADQVIKIRALSYLGLAALLLYSSMVNASDSIPGKAQTHPIAIVGATIHPVSGPEIANGTIVFDGGKIIAIGQNLSLSQGTEVIDGIGKHVYPGLMLPYSYLGLTEIEQVRPTLDFSETGDINPNVRAQSAFNPDSELIPTTRANGVTMAVSTPMGSLISGMSAVMLLDGWSNEDMTLKAPAALNVVWPRMINEGDKKKELDKERDAKLKVLSNAFSDARAYSKAKKAEGKKRVPYHDVDVRWEAMIPVIEGTVPVVVWADEMKQIEAAVEFAEREKIKLIIGGGEDAWRVTDLLIKHNVPVLVGPLQRLPRRRIESYSDPLTLPLKLSQAGVKFAIGSHLDLGRDRNLPYQAAMAAAFGLPKDEALKSVTLYPAQIFGVADRVGSLEVGKDATLIITTGDPLEIMTQVTMEFIQGKKVDLSSRHTRLYEKYKQKYEH